MGSHSKRWHDLTTSLRFLLRSFRKASFVLWLCGFFAGVAAMLLADALLVDWVAERLR